MRFFILMALALAPLAASTDATALSQEQVRTSRRFLAALEPSLSVASELEKDGIDIDSMIKCFKGLNAKGITMTKKEDRVTITKQCVFTAYAGGDVGKVDDNSGKGAAPKGRDPRAISVEDFSKLSLSGEPNPNLCTKNTKLQLHDGTQQPRRCAAVDLGEIPADDKCPSQIFISPNNGGVLRANKPIKFKVAISNLATGFFSDPAIEYYKFPQMLNKQGLIMGHSHITVQEIGNAKSPPSAQSFEVFQGLNDPAVNNVFTLNVAKGLPAGNYRACTLSGSFAHTPVLCPKAKRGAQEDCIRFRVK